MKKMVFIDTNCLIACFEEQEELDIKALNSLKKKMDEEKIFLVLPENIKIETFKILEKTFCSVKEDVKKKVQEIITSLEKNTNKKLLTNSFKEAEKNSIKNKAKHYRIKIL